jgi:sugar/nucleoside kinase (ribokinase family)
MHLDSPDVAVLGAAAVDWVAHVPELPRRDDIVWVERYESFSGGSGGNIAEALARMGKRVCFLGKLGDDEGGKLLKKAFRQAGVDMRGMRIEKGQRSSSCFIAVDGRGDRIIFALGGTAIYEQPEEIEAEWLAGVHILVITDAFPHVAQAAVGALDAGARVVFNPGGLMVSYAAEQMDALLKSSHVLIVSRGEALQLTGCNGAEESTRNLAARGPQVVMQTMGDKGALVLSDGELVRIPAHPNCRVVDTTGAGDAFTAGVTLGMLQGLDWPAVARMGCAVASVKIGYSGARNGLPNQRQAQALLRAAKKIIGEVR